MNFVFSSVLSFNPVGMSEQGGRARGGRARGRARQQQQEQSVRRPGEGHAPQQAQPCPPPGFQHARPRTAAPQQQQQQVRDCWLLHAVGQVTMIEKRLVLDFFYYDILNITPRMSPYLATVGRWAAQTPSSRRACGGPINVCQGGSRTTWQTIWAWPVVSG